MLVKFFPSLSADISCLHFINCSRFINLTVVYYKQIHYNKVIKESYELRAPIRA